MLVKLTFALSLLTVNLTAASEFTWPDGKKAAISLGYDDALNSQLDNAIPALDKYQLKGTFYLVADAQALRGRLEEWRKAAKNGHELGNHTLFHSCSKSKADRAWVADFNNLDSKTLDEQLREIMTANTLLEAIDGERIRTFTLPCFDNLVEGRSYIPMISKMFAGVKSHSAAVPESMANFDVKNSGVFAPNQHSGEALIAIAKQAYENGTIASYTFHGIGGDHLSVSNQAHEELLQYLANNQDKYWVDNFRNISLYITKQQKAKN